MMGQNGVFIKGSMRHVIIILLILCGYCANAQYVSARYNLRLNAAGNLTVRDTAGNWKPVFYQSDTTAILSPYLRKFDTTSMLAAYLRRSDTTVMLTPYLRKFDTTAMLSVYLRSTTAAATYATIAQNASKINIADSAAMLGVYLRKFDTTAMLSVYLRSTVAAATYAAISHTHTKANITDFAHTHTISDITNLPYSPTYALVAGSNATTTGQALTNITGLSVALVANGVYEFEAVLMTQVTNVTTGIQYGVNFSAAGASVVAQITGAFTSTASKTERISSLNSATSAYMTTGNGTGGILIKGILTVGANAGNLTIQHLKVTSGTSTVLIGSFLKVTRIS